MALQAEETQKRIDNIIAVVFLNKLMMTPK